MLPDNLQHLTREELAAQIARLDVRVRGVSAQRADLTHRLALLVCERERLERHLTSMTEEETAC